MVLTPVTREGMKYTKEIPVNVQFCTACYMNLLSFSTANDVFGIVKVLIVGQGMEYIRETMR